MADIMIIGVILICVAGVLVYFRKRRKSGNSCCCGCSGCVKSCPSKEPALKRKDVNL